MSHCEIPSFGCSRGEDVSWQHALPALGLLRASVSLAAHTTLAIGGDARWFFKPNDRQSLVQSMSMIPESVVILPLGRGSNLLISDAGFDGLVLDLGGLQMMQCDDLVLQAEAGCRMSKIAQLTALQGGTGLEFMATVPGDLGGGVAMNAGAFGQQVSDTLCCIDIVHRSGAQETISRQSLQMDYRHTILPVGSIVVSATFELMRKESEVIKMRMREMRQQRSRSQPLALPNCGSVFKNPEGDYAARLIEAAGLKGCRHGNAQISEMHANFIVNHGGACAQDVLNLVKLAQQRVFESFGVLLEPEVRVLGAGGKAS